MRQKQEYDGYYKIILLGDNGVGKSSLLQRYLGKHIDFYDYIDTYGVDSKLKVLNIFNKTIELRIWDASGNPKVRNLVTPYIPKSDGAIVCFDLTNITSFEKVQEFVEYYKTYKKNAPIILLGCKSDKVTQRKVSFEQAKELAEKLNIDYIEASALEKINVNKGFEEITKQIHYYNQIGKIRAKLEKILNHYLAIESSKNISGFFTSPKKDDLLGKKYQENLQHLFQAKHVSALHEFCSNTLELIEQVERRFKNEHPILDLVSSSPLAEALKHSFIYVMEHVTEETIEFSLHERRTRENSNAS